MDELFRCVESRIVELKRKIKIAEQEFDSFPEGSLRITNYHNKKCFFKMMEKGDTLGEYIPVGNTKLVKGLAQKGYNRKFIKAANEELRKLEQFSKWLSNPESVMAERVYSDLSDIRRGLVEPYMISNEEFARRWQAARYKSNPNYLEDKIYRTRRGEMVRSKSEAIIADILDELKIPYRYEEEIRLKMGREIISAYPDFRMLKKSTREIKLLEHFGLLDDDEYLTRNIRKVNIYKENGINLGVNLLVTYEGAGSSLDTVAIRKMLTDAML